MATYTFDGNADQWTGNNTFTDTSAGGATITLVDGDIVNMFGNYTGSSGSRKIRTTVGVRFQNLQDILPGSRGAWTLNGSESVVDLNPTGRLFGLTWTNLGDSTYEINLPASFSVANGGVGAVAVRFDQTLGTFTNGADGGLLQRRINVAAIVAPNNHVWHFNITTRKLTVRSTAIVDPDSDIRVVLGEVTGTGTDPYGTNGAAFTGQPDGIAGGPGSWSMMELGGVSHVYGGVFYLGSPRGSGYGTLFIGTASRGSTIKRCWYSNCGYHCAGATAGSGTTGIIIEDCVFSGCLNHTGSTLTVNYSTAASGISGARERRNRYIIHGGYLPNGAHLPPDEGYSYIGGMNATYAHGAANCVADMEVSECTCLVDESMFLANSGPRPNACIPYHVGETIACRGNPHDYRNYPVRVIDCVTTAWSMWVYAPNTGTGTAIAFHRCWLPSGTHAPSAGLTLLSFGAGSGGSFGIGVNANNARVLLSATLLSSTLRTDATTGFGFIGLGSGTPVNNRLHFIKSTLLHTGSLSGRSGGEALICPRHSITAQTCVLEMRSCVLAFTDNGTYTGTANTWLLRDQFGVLTTALAPNVLQFSDNAYFIGNTSTVWASNTPSSTYNNVAKLSSTDPASVGLDPAGVYGTSPAFVDGGTVNTNGRPSPAFLLATRKPNSQIVNSLAGRNKRRGSNPGVYQDSPDLNDIGGSSDRARRTA
jgi:hypothetical protein